jgi:peptidoglycan/xylan/chitin deacetylase (PgdA/CDA1 family)
MLVLYPTLRPSSQWLGSVITRFETATKQAWLTIDDGPTADTRAVLDLFDAHRVKATFFVKGTLAEQQPELVREIVARGHSVANHSQTHPSGTFWCLLRGRIADEIERCNDALQRATGAPVRWFRAPVGMKNPFVHPVLRRHDMRLIGWTARGFDGVLTDADEIVARILPKLVPGAIIVMHQGREHSLRALESVIVALQERGYELVIPDDAALRA